MHKNIRPTPLRLPLIVACVSVAAGLLTVFGLARGNDSLDVRAPAPPEAKAADAVRIGELDAGDLRIAWTRLDSSFIGALMTDGKSVWFTVGEGGTFSSVFVLTPGKEPIKIADLPDLVTLGALTPVGPAFSWANVLSRIDANGSTTQVELPADGADAAVAAVAAMGSNLLLVRSGTNDILELDAATLRIGRQQKLPAGLPTPTQLFALSSDLILVSTPYGRTSTTAASGVLDLRDGSFAEVDLGRPFRLSGTGGRLSATQSRPVGGLVEISAEPSVSARPVESHIPWSGRTDRAVRTASGATWGAPTLAGAIFFDPENGPAADSFSLPTYRGLGPDGPVYGVRTVDDMVVLDDGTLVFSSGSFGGRIGIIHPPK